MLFTEFDCLSHKIPRLLLPGNWFVTVFATMQIGLQFASAQTITHKTFSSKQSKCSLNLIYEVGHCHRETDRYREESLKKRQLNICAPADEQMVQNI